MSASRREPDFDTIAREARSRPLREVSPCSLLSAPALPPRSSPLPWCRRSRPHDKAFKTQRLDDAAIKLEAQIKQDAGTVTKSLATLRKEADAAFTKRDYRTGMLVLSRW